MRAACPVTARRKLPGLEHPDVGRRQGLLEGCGVTGMLDTDIGQVGGAAETVVDQRTAYQGIAMSHRVGNLHRLRRSGQRSVT